MSRDSRYRHILWHLESPTLQLFTPTLVIDADTKEFEEPSSFTEELPPTLDSRWRHLPFPSLDGGAVGGVVGGGGGGVGAGGGGGMMGMMDAAMGRFSSGEGTLLEGSTKPWTGSTAEPRWRETGLPTNGR